MSNVFQLLEEQAGEKRQLNAVPLLDINSSYLCDSKWE